MNEQKLPDTFVGYLEQTDFFRVYNNFQRDFQAWLFEKTKSKNTGETQKLFS
jgi:hypothetical protein